MTKMTYVAHSTHTINGQEATVWRLEPNTRKSLLIGYTYTATLNRDGRKVRPALSARRAFDEKWALANLRTEMKRQLVDRTVVITGTLWSERAEVARLIAKAGGRFSNSVTSKTDVLVVGREPGKTKLRAAHYNGVTVITERQLRNRLGVRNAA